MSFKVVENVIKGKLAVVKRTDRSKQLYARFRNADAKVKYSYISLNTTSDKKAFKLALAEYDKVQKGEVAFSNAEETFDLYVREAIDNYNKRVTRGQITKLFAKYAIQTTTKYPLKYFGLRNINDITSNDLDDFIEWCHKQHKDTLSQRTIEKIRDATNAVFKEAERSIKSFNAPIFRKDPIKGAKSTARAIFEQHEIITMAKRARKHWEALALEQDEIRDGTEADYKHNEKFTIKGRNFMYFKDTHEYKMQFADVNKYYTERELYEFYNFITFMVNTYLRTSEWADIKLKHCAIKKMTKEEIGDMRESARKSFEKRDSKYAKFEKVEVYVVEAKNKGSKNTKRVFYRGAIDTIRRQTKQYDLKANDYLFFNHVKSRTLAEEKMRRLFDAFLVHHNTKQSTTNETRTMYSLRHSGILMSLNAGVDVYMLANNADTGVKMIEQYYGSRVKNTKTASLLV